MSYTEPFDFAGIQWHVLSPRVHEKQFETTYMVFAGRWTFFFPAADIERDGAGAMLRKLLNRWWAKHGEAGQDMEQELRHCFESCKSSKGRARCWTIAGCPLTHCPANPGPVIVKDLRHCRLVMPQTMV